MSAQMSNGRCRTTPMLLNDAGAVKSNSALWQKLCALYLPVTAEHSVWRYSRVPTHDDPEQGWKLHICATVLTANRVLEKIAPFLHTHKALFKAPSSLIELNKINSGLYYGYSQVGKFLTVYPKTVAESVFFARHLHRKTYGMSAPAVPFDLHYRPGSCVYYRYGAFKSLEIENADGTRIYALRSPEGKLIPDARDSTTVKPDWVADPFPARRTRRIQPLQFHGTRTIENPLKTTFRAFRALTQRGKGGVYLAIDLSTSPPRPCILKEGRRDGEIGWDGRDGCWRVKREERVLLTLRNAGVEVPGIYSSFEVEGHYYLVTEFIEGETLLQLLSRKRRRISISRVIEYGLRLSMLLSKIHAAGWVWRDCKPTNIIVTGEGKLRPLDFEGACLIDDPAPTKWFTPELAPPECFMYLGEQSRVAEDLYALGAIMYLLLTGKLPVTSSGITPINRLRRNVPQEVSNIVSELLSHDPQCRPDATTVEQKLRVLSLNRCGLTIQCPRLS